MGIAFSRLSEEGRQLGELRGQIQQKIMYRRLLAEDQVYGRHSISYKEDEEDDGTDDDDYNDKTIF